MHLSHDKPVDWGRGVFINFSVFRGFWGESSQFKCTISLVTVDCRKCAALITIPVAL